MSRFRPGRWRFLFYYYRGRSDVVIRSHLGTRPYFVVAVKTRYSHVLGLLPDDLKYLIQQSTLRVNDNLTYRELTVC